MQWYFEVLKKYAVFSGRARRKEYWMFCLFNTIIGLCLALIDVIIGIATKSDQHILLVLYALAVILPALAVGIRRLHDIGRSAWWLFISLVPVIGGMVFFVFMVLDSQPGDNRYGPNPKLARIVYPVVAKVGGLQSQGDLR